MRTEEPVYRDNRASKAQVAEHLRRCDRDFRPFLSSRVDIDAYADKLCATAHRCEAWCGNELIALVAAYLNDQQTRTGFVSSVSVLPAWRQHGLGATLLRRCLAQAQAAGMRRLRLQVGMDNSAALTLYNSFGFTTLAASEDLCTLELCLPESPK